MKEPNKTLIYDLSDLSYRQFKKICLELFPNRYDRDEIEFFYNEKTHKDTVLIYNDRLKWSLHLKSLCKPTANALELFITKPEFKVNKIVVGNKLEHSYPIKWDLEVICLTEDANCKTITEPARECYFKKITDSISDLLEYKNKKYGNSALEPLNIFDGKCKVGKRLDDKIARVKNNETLQKNDVADLIGYLILTCKEFGWENFDEFKD